MAVSGAQHTYQSSAIANVPEEPGAYELLSGSTTIYFGWTDVPGLRTKIREHYSGKHGSCTQIATAFRFETHSEPEDRCQKLIAEHKKQHGTVPRCNL